MRSAFGRLSIAQRGPFHDAPVRPTTRNETTCAPPTSSPMPSRRTSALRPRSASRRLREFSGMPRLFGGPKIPGIDPVAVARRHISDQRTGVPQRTEVLHVRGDLIETQWPCYHSELDVFSLAGQEVGIVGRAVGASFAV